MSTLKVDNLLNSAGNESPISVPGAAKAWVNFNGVGTVSIRDSFNISTLTDNGTGDYTIAFTNSFSNTNYCVVTGGYNTNAGDGGWNAVGSGSTSSYPAGLATGSVRLNSFTGAGNIQDQQAIYVAIFCND